MNIPSQKLTRMVAHELGRETESLTRCASGAGISVTSLRAAKVRTLHVAPLNLKARTLSHHPSIAHFFLTKD